MKIIQIIQKPQLRGAEMFASQLSNHLQAQGHEVVLVSLFKGAGELRFSGKQIHLGLASKLRWLDFAGFKSLAAIIKNEKPDIIQANAGDTLKYAVLSKLMHGWPQPIVFRNASMVSLYIKNPVIKKLNGFLYQNVEGIASVSQQSKKDLNDLFPNTENKSKVIPIGIEPKLSEGPDTKSSLSKQSGDPERNESGKRELCIVHVGGFSFEKNHQGLLSIFKKLLKEYPNAQLKLVGDGVLRKETEQLVQDTGITNYVEFLGFQSDPMHYVRQADVFVLPSIIEGLPGVILEAFDCQIPVVAYNVGGVGEVVKNEQTGILMKKGDEEGFVEAIIETIENPDATKERVKRAYELVQKDFRNEVIAEKFADYYKEVLDSRRL
ncbi:glycosyltransferase [Marivirga arenosa]|uniref:Glycosyltransferase n=1 Tax=Marivirga arenosa TaxID=3059076 RepID=A0AA51N5V1_9BACT|nr:glycosyltransferase [Marivirga sp. ABR2-2]WMN06807.1 glycosyltransferase [Marivirga sp. ABR2-2]